jgi:hypothetical protein
MAHLVFGMNVSLDGFVDHDRFAPSPALFRHFVAEAEGQVGSLYGRLSTASEGSGQAPLEAKGEKKKLDPGSSPG